MKKLFSKFHPIYKTECFYETRIHMKKILRRCKKAKIITVMIRWKESVKEKNQVVFCNLRKIK